MRFPHDKIVDRYLFSCPSFASFLSYVPLKTKFETFVCKISQKAFELKLTNLVYLFGLGWLITQLNFQNFTSNLNKTRIGNKQCLLDTPRKGKVSKKLISAVYGANKVSKCAYAN